MLLGHGTATRSPVRSLRLTSVVISRVLLVATTQTTLVSFHAVTVRFFNGLVLHCTVFISPLFLMLLAAMTAFSSSGKPFLFVLIVPHP